MNRLIARVLGGPAPQLAGFRSRTGRSVAIRSARPDDTEAIATMISTLSARTVERRYLTPRVLCGDAAHREAERLTSRTGGGIVLVAQDGGAFGSILAVAELVPFGAERGVAEGAIVVADACQGEGIGRAVLQEMAAAAEDAAISSVRATTHAYNTPVRRLIASSGRPYTARFVGAEVQYEVALG